MGKARQCCQREVWALNTDLELPDRKLAAGTLIYGEEAAEARRRGSQWLSEAETLGRKGEPVQRVLKMGKEDRSGQVRELPYLGFRGKELLLRSLGGGGARNPISPEA